MTKRNFIGPVPPKKYLSHRRRHLGSTALDIILKESFQKYLVIQHSKFKRLLLDETSELDDIEDAYRKLKERINVYNYRFCNVEQLNQSLTRIERKNIRIHMLEEEHVLQWFRFMGKEQLTRCFTCFQFPDTFRSKHGVKFSGEEIMLAGFYRLHHVNTFYDPAWKHLFGYYPQIAQTACAIFFEYMYDNLTDSDFKGA
jgi:hypothetical protein